MSSFEPFIEREDGHIRIVLRRGNLIFSLGSQRLHALEILFFSSSSLSGLFPGGSEGKASACNAGDQDSVPGLGRSPGEGNGYLLQYSGLENSMDRGAWRATLCGVAELDTTEQLHFHFFTFPINTASPM